MVYRKPGAVYCDRYTDLIIGLLFTLEGNRCR